MPIYPRLIPSLRWCKELRRRASTSPTSRMKMVAAWTVALLAELTHQSYLIDHYYLLEESHLPILIALAVFLACWQVMTVGIMLPSSMPILYIVVHASRRQKYTRRIQVAFMAGYALVWTLFGVAAFRGEH